MTAVDFVLYCAGSGLLMLSAAGAFRLLVGDKKPARPPAPPASQPQPEEVGVDMGLTDRLRRFQEQRFASPIIKRQLDRDGYTPSPGEPGGRRVIPPIGQLRPLRQPPPAPKGRTFSAPKQPPVRPAPPKQETSNVVPFPQKQVKPDEPPKED